MKLIFFNCLILKKEKRKKNNIFKKVNLCSNDYTIYKFNRSFYFNNID